MAQTILIEPSPLSLSRNPVVFRVQSDQQYASPGVKAVSFLQFSGAVANNDLINLQWGLKQQGFLAQTTPDDSGAEFPTGDGSASYVASLVSIFQNNYQIDQDFIVTASSTQLIFTAREKGAAFNFASGTSGNMTTGVTTTGTDQVEQENFRNYMELWVRRDDASSFQRMYYHALDADPDGISTADFSEVLDSLLESDTPNMKHSVGGRCRRSAASFYIRYAEAWGEMIGIRKMHQTGTYRIIKGGFDYRNAPTRSALDLKPWLIIGEDSEIFVQPETPLFLQFLLKEEVNKIRLKVELYFTDDTSYSYTHQEYSNLTSYAKVSVPAGFHQLGIYEREPSKTASHYILYMQDTAGNDIGDRLIFRVDRSYREYQRYFPYENSLGGYQTMFAYGRAESAPELAQEAAEKLLPFNYDTTAGSSLNYNIQLKEKVTVSTGFTSRRGIFKLRDFYLSEYKFLEEHLSLLPVGVKAGKVRETKDGETVFAAEFEYEMLFDDRSYTEDWEVALEGRDPDVFVTEFDTEFE